MKSMMFVKNHFDFSFSYLHQLFDENGIHPESVTFGKEYVEINFKDEYDFNLADDILRGI